MSSFLSSIVGTLENPYAGIVEEGFVGGDVDGYMDTGAYMLNALMSADLYKGSPNGKIVCLAGPQATGKTFFALAIVRSFLNANPNACVIYFETEGAVSRETMKQHGIDTKRVVGVPVATIEQFAHQSIRVIERYLKLKPEERLAEPMMFVLDSLGMLTTEKSLADTVEGKNTKDMTRSQLIKGTFRLLTLKLGLANISMIVTNHTYAAVGAYMPTQELSGGSGTKYAGSIILFLSKKKERDGDQVVGNIIHVKNEKNRLAKENAMIDVMLSYKDGLSKYYGLLEFGIKHKIFQESGNRTEVPIKFSTAKTEEEAINFLNTFSGVKINKTEKTTKGAFVRGKLEGESFVFSVVGKKETDKKVIGYWDSLSGNVAAVAPKFEKGVKENYEVIFSKPTLDALNEAVKNEFGYGNSTYSLDTNEVTSNDSPDTETDGE